LTTTPNTKAGLTAFLEMAITKGMVNSNTGGAWRAAVNAIMDDLEDDATVDGFDVRAAVLRYNNRFPGELTGESLKKYEQRAKSAIEQYTAWKADPMGYKPPSRGLPGAEPAKKKITILRRRPQPGAVAAPTAAPAPPPNGSAGLQLLPLLTTPPDALTIPIPIRAGKFIVQVIIPADFTADDAKRVSAVVHALGTHIVEPT
jgi:hypothetical protein